MVQHLKDEGTRSQVVLAGAAAGLVSRFVIAPLDVVKIRLQLQIHSLTDPLSYRGVRGPTYKGIVYTAKEIFRQEGLTVSGFYLCDISLLMERTRLIAGSCC
jgi:solute carrier family 25 thiamine pyrophosphate transporter 19